MQTIETRSQAVHAQPTVPVRYAQLDGLRALAVAGIMWFHFAPTLQFGLPFASGVSLFFVISGFLITGILLDSRRYPPAAALKRFYARRALRILPIFYITLSAGLILDVGKIREVAWWHLFYAQNFLTGLFNVRTGAFQHFWSLAVEEQFYFVWPFVILLVPSRRLLPVILATVCISPAFKLFMALRWPELRYAQMLPFSCLDTLAIGALLAWLSRFGSGSVLKTARWFGAVGFPVTIALGAYRFLSGSDDLPLLVDPFRGLAIALFFGWLVVESVHGFKGAVGKFLGHPLVAYIGTISYGLYVYHMFTPWILKWAFPKFFSQHLAVQILCNAALSLTMAVASWQLLEKPLNDLKRRFHYGLC